MTSSTAEVIDLTEFTPGHPIFSSTRSVEFSSKDPSLQEDVAAASGINLEASDKIGPSISLLDRISIDERKPKKGKNKGADSDSVSARNSEQDLKTAARRMSENSASNGSAVHLENSASSSLFFFDDAPGVPTSDDAELPKADESATAGQSDLLLPKHIQIGFTNSEAQHDTEDSPPTQSDKDDFILYADMYESRNTFARYYNEQESIDRLTHYVCGHCAAEGAHKTSDCPVLICLTCGAHNEHGTRQCPISKSCFTCGLKGHISKDCNNLKASRRIEVYDDCGRCGSRVHNSKECPTLWRIYNYVEDKERDAILQARSEVEDRKFGDGGERYIGNALWCYNCGYEGHLGDNCEEMNHPYDYPKDPSAFSDYNMSSGPFSDRINDTCLRPQRKHQSRDDDGYPGPTRVGKRGREKERERMRLQEEESRLDEEEEDWFGRRLNSARDNAARNPAEHNGRKRDSKISIRIQNNLKPNDFRSKESLQTTEELDTKRKNSKRARRRRGNDFDGNRQETEVDDNDQDTSNDKGWKRNSERGGYRSERYNGRDSKYESRRRTERRKERTGRQYFGGYGR